MGMLACATGDPPSNYGTLPAPEESAATGMLLGLGERIALVHAAHSEDASRMRDCLISTMQEADPTMPIVPDEVLDGGPSPWLGAGKPPGTQPEFTALMRQSAVRERFAQLRVRYVVYVSGFTSTNQEFVSAAPIAAGVAGEVRSALAADVWDIKRSQLAGDAGASMSGPAGGGIFILVPYAYGPDAENRVCDEVGWRLAQFFRGGRLVRPLEDTTNPHGRLL
jgi:hypothetical protein